MGALVQGIRVNDLQKHKPLVADNIIAGHPYADTSNNSLVLKPDEVLIGSRLAVRLGARVGDKIGLVAPETTTTILGNIPRMKEYKIAGIFEVGMYEYDTTTIFMPLPAAQTFFRKKQHYTSIELYLDDAANAPHIVQRIHNQIKDVNGYRIMDWQRSNGSFFQALEVERTVMFLILTLIILVAAFNIISSMIMLVKEKRRDVAILRTMGLRRGSAMRIFIICGATIGVVGTTIGTVLGLLFATNIEAIREWLQSILGTELFAAEIYYLSQLPAEVVPYDVIRIVVMALALALVATLYPAWRAASIHPAEGVKGG